MLCLKHLLVQKHRLGIVLWFKRMLRRFIDIQLRLFGQQIFAKAKPKALDLHNRYLNRRSIQQFMLREVNKKDKHLIRARKDKRSTSILRSPYELIQVTHGCAT